MKVYSRFLALLCATTYIGVFFLRIFHYGFIYGAPGEIIMGSFPTVLITLVLITICAIVQKPVLTRFEASSSGEAGKNSHIVATEIRRLSDNIRFGECQRGREPLVNCWR
ncbi:MAG: hypothetical protein IJL80_09860 [Treponema sp.]|nr:hypothetical protein [Treponema sp.]